MTRPQERSEARSVRWKRRAVTIPVMLGITIVGVLGFPVLVVAAALGDAVRLRLRFPTVRVYLFLLQYAINDSVEILLAPVLWVRAGFGARIEAPASVRRHEQLKAWSLFVMARRARRFLGVRVEVDAQSVSMLVPGPVIVLCRHVSMLDASLPALLYMQLGYRVRGVLMAELLADPGFDLLYSRTGSVFIARDGGSAARARIAQLASDLEGSTAVVIFPEGRLFRPDVLQEQQRRLATRDAIRAARLRHLCHVLPPRPAGVSALLDAAPDTDVVVVAHAGLERYGSVRRLAVAAPLRDPITVGVWRVPAGDIPKEPERRTAWLDDQWCRVDAWVTAHTTR
jgi:1-acyl-sn-glycerol-3-phosphate acyltransferase